MGDYSAFKVNLLLIYDCFAHHELILGSNSFPSTVNGGPCMVRLLVAYTPGKAQS